MASINVETPLRRSGIGFRKSIVAQHNNVTINDDDEERRARRRTLLQNISINDGSTIEDSEALKNCLEMYNGNKISRDNAWNLSLIDTLSNLLDRHNKSLNNFKVAGSSLEASSKVYGLRVDSIHIDVLRMSAGLNSQKFNEKDIRDDGDDDFSNRESNPTQVDGAEGAENAVTTDPTQKAKPKLKPKRQRKVVSTITKNKDSLNARLDMVPLKDPVFGKLNSVVGSINSSNRLMNNILPTMNSELRLRTNYRFWDSSDLPSNDYTAEVHTIYPDSELINCDWLTKLQRYDNLILRPLHSGYIISDTPDPVAPIENEAERRDSMSSNHDNDIDFYQHRNIHTMAFDLNAECEPMPALDDLPPMLEVDFNDYDELTKAERTAINHCRGLRRPAVVIADLRPVDANSKLEYSYRPIDKISQFWAGPSHWKFKRLRSRGSTLTQDGVNIVRRENEQRRSKRAQLLAKRRSKKLNFGEYHDELFVKINGKTKVRKTNFQKKWDQRKLKLPTDMKIDPQQFFKYKYAPGVPVCQQTISDDDELCGVLDNAQSNHLFDGAHFNEGDDDNFINIQSMSAHQDGAIDNIVDGDNMDIIGGVLNNQNETILEISTQFADAPTQVTKIIVPFAKRAKVIDMKNLKRSCAQLLSKQMRQPIDPAIIPEHRNSNKEKYADGVASFQMIYDELPTLLSVSMASSMTPSVAFYSVLHLANDMNLRLIGQSDLEDFKIRQVL